MKTLTVCTTLVILTAAGLSAQTPAPADTGYTATLRASWNSVKRYVVASAEKMPEANYAFKPTPEVRSFGELLTHVAGASYEFCASAKNEKAPFAEDAFEKKTMNKADIVKVTNDAIAYCDAAFAALTDANAGTMVKPAFGGEGQTRRVSSLVGQIGHDNEHYGNMVTYFRLKGLVPPSSRPR